MEGGRYHAEPVSLIYDDNNYYMLSFSKKYGHMINYRVDHMDQVRVEEESVSEEAMRKISNAEALVEEGFRMYLGETKAVTLQFHDKVIGWLYDKFGEKLQIRRIGPNLCETQVNVQISPPFWSWLFMMQEDLSLVGPDDLIKEYRVHLSNALNKMS